MAWLGASLAASRHQPAAADSRYRAAVAGLAEHGNAVDAAIAVMEFAQFLLVQGRALEIESLCLVAAARINALGLSQNLNEIWQVFLAGARSASLQRRELIKLVELARVLRRKPGAEIPKPS